MRASRGPRPARGRGHRTFLAHAARAALAAALLLVAAACAQPTGARALSGPGGQPAPAGIAVNIHSAHPGAVIPSSFLGLSMETPVVDSPAVVCAAPALVRLIRQLGPRVL